MFEQECIEEIIVIVIARVVNMIIVLDVGDLGIGLMNVMQTPIIVVEESIKQYSSHFIAQRIILQINKDDFLRKKWCFNA
jgi:hypothetical protein